MPNIHLSQRRILRALHARKRLTLDVLVTHGKDLLAEPDPMFSRVPTETMNHTAFREATTLAFFKIIYHLDPHRAEQLGVPRPSDLKISEIPDPERLARLVEYVHCGRLSEDCAEHYYEIIN